MTHLSAIRLAGFQGLWMARLVIDRKAGIQQACWTLTLLRVSFMLATKVAQVVQTAERI